MRSVTTFSTQSRTNGLRATHAGLRMRARRGPRVHRYPVRAVDRRAWRNDVRVPMAGGARVAAPRQRPEVRVRGFLPLVRH
jgi:hypothetical protein